jgi:hypothetical protein
VTEGIVYFDELISSERYVTLSGVEGSTSGV